MLHTGINHFREVHAVQTHVLCYGQLLERFRDSVEFVGQTPNPAMGVESINDQERKLSTDLMAKEVTSLLSEISRLEAQGRMLSDRLENVVLLVRYANTSLTYLTYCH